MGRSRLEPRDCGIGGMGSEQVAMKAKNARGQMMKVRRKSAESPQKVRRKSAERGDGVPSLLYPTNGGSAVGGPVAHRSRLGVYTGRKARTLITACIHAPGMAGSHLILMTDDCIHPCFL